MNDITVEHHVSPVKLDMLEVDSWPIWSKEESEFDWHYDQAETCYILEGLAIVTPEQGEAVEIGEGDLVTFAKGLSCRWEIREAIKKHYIFK